MARRKKVKKSTIVKIVVIATIVTGAAAAGIIYAKKYVSKRFADTKQSYISAEATISDLSTRVSGTGSLADSDTEDYDVPENVDIDEVVVEVGDKVEKGQTLAKINTNSVLSAMYEIQAKIDAIDKQLQKASEQKAATTITSQVKGRVKAVYVKKNSNVISTMTSKNALIIISLDGKMAVEVEHSDLKSGKKVKVKVGKTVYSGYVKNVSDGKARVVITDNGPALGAQATVTSTDGKTTYGTGKLEVNSPLSIVAYAGKVSSVKVKNNQWVKKGKVLLKLTSTSYTANYDKLIKDRADLAEDLHELLRIYNDGAILAQMSGTIKAVPSTDDSETSTSSATNAATGNYGNYDNYGQSSSTDTSTTEKKSDTFSICPDLKMTVEVSVDENDILSISKGQSAEVTVDSLEKTVKGTITEIDKSGTTTDGTVGYTAEITLDKQEGMLAGMSCSVLIAVTEHKNSIIIPTEALNNTGSSYFVYTSYDPETNTPGGMVEVKVGIQNDSYAQITEGIKEGDTVWYKEPEQNPFQRYMNRSNGNNRNNNYNYNRNRNQGGYNRPQGGYGGNRSGGNNNNRTQRRQTSN